MNITIDDAKIQDIPTMLRWGKSTRELWGDESGEWYERKDLVEWIRHPGEDVIIVARDGKKLVGMCFAYQMRGWAYCDILYIDPPYRRKGTGIKLLAEAQRRTKSKSSAFGLLVEKDNQLAQSFYKKYAFRQGFSVIWMFKKVK